MSNKQVLYQGAEAKIIRSTFLNISVICKTRLKKRYRIKEIDQRLIRSRTRDEAKLMTLARQQGVCVPIVFDIDLERGVLTLQYLTGVRVKDCFNDFTVEQKKRVCKQIGSDIARLHNADIIHGDLTTSNLIYDDDKLFFIDFGLGEFNPDVEAKGVDLHVLMEAIESTHSAFASFFSFVFEGYKQVYNGNADEVKKKIDDIVRRGRYR